MSSRSGTNRSYAERKAKGRPIAAFTLPAETLEALERLAAARGLSKSALVASLIDAEAAAERRRKKK